MTYEGKVTRYTGDHAELYGRMANSLDLINSVAPEGRGIGIWMEIWTNILTESRLVKTFIDLFVGTITEENQ